MGRFLTPEAFQPVAVCKRGQAQPPDNDFHLGSAPEAAPAHVQLHKKPRTGLKGRLSLYTPEVSSSMPLQDDFQLEDAKYRLTFGIPEFGPVQIVEAADNPFGDVFRSVAVA
jgi:hypothetical protein